ncbi:cation transporting ATPase C-terminal domain-containing protein [Streptomyces sp. NPDC051684]|uniref:cation transporting ATPase C-terminal domain-containing protein n=1 Tax=Streptomyces sp. NPDC051684 TaxID=3365670 RepID=UPI0037AC4AC3
MGDPTEGALLVLGHKAGLDVAATRERLPRLATLPFDPAYKLMATFHAAHDGQGRPVVRCFVKGAAPAVLARTTTALSDGAGIAFDAELRGRADGECRSQTGTALTVDTFDSKQLNWTILAEFVLAVLVTQTDAFNRLLDTVPLGLGQFGWALLPALALLALWELGKLIARRR